MSYSVIDKKTSLDSNLEGGVYIVRNELLETTEDWVFEAVLMGVKPMAEDPVKEFIQTLETLYDSVRVYREGWTDIQKGCFTGLSLLSIEFGDRDEASLYAEKLNEALPS